MIFYIHRKNQSFQFGIDVACTKAGMSLLNLFQGKGSKKIKPLIVAEDETLEKFQKQFVYLSNKKFDSITLYNLNGYCRVWDKNNGFKRISIKCSNGIDGINQIIKRIQPTEVFIAYPMSYYTLVDIMFKLGQEKIKIMLSPDVYQKCVGEIARKCKWVLPAVELNNGNISLSYRIAKRCLDIFISILALIILSPIFLIVPILIKLESKGPVFFTQIRAGQHGRPFKMYKFRSMVVDAEKILQKFIDFEKLDEPVFKFKNDPRVTFIGRILRKTSIDELPQLFNVLKGEMSLVGPRPEEIGLVKRYNAFFRERLKVKPGITGLQQIHCRGTPNMMERMKYDLAYIRNQSLWLDLKILFKTIWVVLQQKGAT